MRLPGLVLAGGRSTRMGAVKALVRLGRRTVLGQVVERLHAAGFGPLRLVVGHHRELLVAAAQELGVEVVDNPAPEEGQISSLRAGLEALPGDAPGVLVHPVDHPGVRASTLELLREAILRGPDRIVVPSHEWRRGHPTWFPREVFGELLDPALAGGARGVVRRDPGRVEHVVVDDPWTLRDLDRPEDLARYLEEEAA